MTGVASSHSKKPAEDFNFESLETPLTFTIGDLGFCPPVTNPYIKDITVFGKYYFKRSDCSFRGIAFLKRLLPADVHFPVKYKLSDKTFKPHKWGRCVFKRHDGLEIVKWRRLDDEEDAEYVGYGEKYVNAFVKVIETLTKSEHDTMNRGDNQWSYEETLYLIEMCKRFGLRYPLIADRYFYKGHQWRDTNKIKARIHYIYNCICILRKQSQLVIDYNPTEDEYNRMRLSGIQDRTTEDIVHMQGLSKKMKEFPMKYYKKKAEIDAAAAAAKAAATLAEQAALTAASVGVGLISSTRSSSSLPPSRLPSVTRAVARSNVEVITDWNKKLENALDTSILRFFNKDALGSHMQSQEFRLLSNVNIKKKANIDYVIDQLETQSGMTMTTFTKEISNLYTKLSLNVNKVTELKNVFAAANGELIALSNELKEKTGEEFNLSGVHLPRRTFDNGDPSLLVHIESRKNPNALVTRRR